jgi:conjugative relaxase-like TrwC/TraI family protein
VVLSSAKIGRGSWRYYQDSVARGACEYYAEGGNAPGRWWGAGLPELGLTPASRVQEQELEALFARGLHPSTGTALGRAWRSDAVTGHDLTFSAPKSVSALWALADEATGMEVRAAHDAAVQAALGFMQAHASFSRRGRDGVEQIGSAGFGAALFEHTTSRTGDPQLHTHALVVNKVRCADGVWRTIDGYEVFHHKKAAGALYQAALRAELGTRLGVVFGPVSEHGQAEIAGIPDELLAAWSTRTAAVMADAVPTIAEREASLGREVSAAERARIVKTAVLATRPPKDRNVPAEGLRERWREQAAALGWTPDRLHRAAARGGARLSAVTESVTDSVTTTTPPIGALAPSAGDSVTDSVAAATSQVSAPPTAGFRADVPAGLLSEAVTAVGRSGAVWSAGDLAVQIAARIPTAGPGAPMAAAGAAALVEAWTARALAAAAAGAVPLGPDPSGATARASDARYASTETVTLEAGIIEAVLDGLRTTRRLPAAVLAAATGDGLSDEQQVAAVRLVASRDLVTLMVAPAGAGKTTVLGAAVAGWTAAGQRVLVLGPSARAASELSASTGRPGATVARFLTQQAHLDQQPDARGTRSGSAPAAVEERRLRRGDVVLVDEASMLATADLANLTNRARVAGARLVLVGDPAQIGAVRAPGGMLEHLTTLIPQRVVELDELHRFAHGWEAAATLALRSGDAEVLDVYRDHDRIHTAASGDDAADAVFERWHTAVDAGVDALMLARGWADVTALNTRARAVAVATGEVSGPVLLEVTARTASSRGRPETRDYRAGDVLMAKKNTRDLEIGGAPLRNGDRFQVLSATPDGRGLVVADLAGRGRTVLPAAYVARHVEYGWAATIDAAQGATTGIAVTLARPGLDREHLYVAMTRGRLGNHLCTAPETPAVDAGPHHDHGTPATARAIATPDVGAAQDHPSPSPEVQADAFDQLARALATTGRERAAHSLLAPAVDTEREAMFHAAENARPAPDLPREHERNVQRLKQASAEREWVRARLEALTSERDGLAARLADVPFWGRRRRHDLITALDTAGRSVEEATVQLAHVEDAVRAAVVVVDADAHQRDADAVEARAARWERWSLRADRDDRDPNLVDAAAPRPRGVSLSGPVLTPRRSRAARADRGALER